MVINYTGAVILTKHTDLLPWFDAQGYDRLALEHSPIACEREKQSSSNCP